MTRCAMVAGAAVMAGTSEVAGAAIVSVAVVAGIVVRVVPVIERAVPVVIVER